MKLSSFRRNISLVSLLSLLLYAGAANAQVAFFPITGTWQANITLVNCQSGVPLGPPFSSFLTFGNDGTLTGDTNNSLFAPSQRSVDHGFWAAHGQGTYSAVSEAFIRFTTDPNPPSPGFPQGIQRIAQSITLQGHNAWTSTATVSFLDPNGNLLRQGCATASAQRMN